MNTEVKVRKIRLFSSLFFSNARIVDLYGMGMAFYDKMSLKAVQNAVFNDRIPFKMHFFDIKNNIFNNKTAF